MELLIFDRAGSPRSFKAKVSDGAATFSGTVRQPVYAELRLTRGAASTPVPLPFFIENSQIIITFDTANPAESRVTGSRSNSRMRYQSELLRDNGTVESLRQHITDNPSESYNAYLLYNALAMLDLADADTLLAMLDGAAKEAWHYPLVVKKLRQLAMLQPGQPLPSFTFVDSTGATLVIDSVIAGMYASWYASSPACGTPRTAIIVGATWCRQCAEALQTVRQSDTTLQVVYIDIDRQKKGWDSPVTEALAIDHIPYIILIDPQSKILAPDLRAWEVGKWRMEN